MGEQREDERSESGLGKRKVRSYDRGGVTKTWFFFAIRAAVSVVALTDAKASRQVTLVLRERWV